MLSFLDRVICTHHCAGRRLAWLVESGALPRFVLVPAGPDQTQTEPHQSHIACPRFSQKHGSQSCLAIISKTLCCRSYLAYILQASNVGVRTRFPRPCLFRGTVTFCAFPLVFDKRKIAYHVSYRRLRFHHLFDLFSSSLRVVANCFPSVAS